MARNLSINKSMLTCVRLNGTPVFTPAHRRADGSVCDPKVEFTGFITERMGKGKENKLSTISFDLWGTRAISFCRYMGESKAMDIEGKLRSFEATKYAKPVAGPGGGMVFNPVLDNMGQPVKYTKTVIRVTDIIFGEEAQSVINKEIASGQRHPNWNIAGTPEKQQFDATRDALSSMLWDGVSPNFGCARVRMVQGMAIIPMAEYLTSKGQVVNAPAQAAPVGYAATAPAGYAAAPNQVVQQVGAAIPAGAPQAGAQVMAGGAVNAAGAVAAPAAGAQVVQGGQW